MYPNWKFSLSAIATGFWASQIGVLSERYDSAFFSWAHLGILGLWVGFFGLLELTIYFKTKTIKLTVAELRQIISDPEVKKALDK